MVNAKEVFDFIFHWAGVWTVMVYGTVGMGRACNFVRRLAHNREKKRLFAMVISRIHTPSKPKDDEHQAQEAEADAVES